MISASETPDIVPAPSSRGSAPARAHTDLHAASLGAMVGGLPLSFAVNKGQTASEVRYLARGSAYTLFLTDGAAVLALNQAPVHRADPASDRTDPSAAAGQHATAVMRMDLVGAGRDVQVSGVDQLPGVANYFLGNDPSRWLTNVPTFARVRYSGVYPGVDLIYYGNDHQLEYDFVVAPGGDPARVRLHFGSGQRVRLEPSGDLSVMVDRAHLTFHKPVTYQEFAGRRQPVPSEFRLLANNSVGFSLGRYDRRRTVIIDPTLGYSTYLGGSGYAIPAGPDCCGDYGNGIAADAEGNAYITGQTGSPNFPVTTGAFQTTQAPNEHPDSPGNAFVTKLNPAGTTVVYSTYLGGSGGYWYGDAGLSIAVDALGNAYVTGSTGSQNFPTTPNAFLKVNKPAQLTSSETAFVTELNPSGSALVYSTFLGGSGVVGYPFGYPPGDVANGLALGPGGTVYVVGTTYSSDFPVTASAFQKKNNASAIGQSNLFVTQLNSSGSGLFYSTYLGGTGYGDCCYVFTGGDYAAGIAVDGTGSAYVTGHSYSLDFPVTPGAYQLKNRADESLGQELANYNAIVSKFDPSGSSLLYSTYLGGHGNPYRGDQAAGIAVDASCFAYVTGQAGSTDFPVTKGAFQTIDHMLYNQISSFVTKFNTTGTALVYSTYLSGSAENDSNVAGDFAYGINVDAAGQAYVVGSTQSDDFPVTKNAFQPQNNQAAYPPADYYSGNAFVTELNSAGTGLVYSSFLGGSGGPNGSGGDSAAAVALDPAGNAYLTGHTLSKNFPVSAGAFQSSSPAYAAGNDSSGNAFVAKFTIGSGAVIRTTQTVLGADANPAASSVKLTFTATVTQPTPCGFPPTGSASFVIDGGKPIVVPIESAGTATYSTSTLSVGTHSVAVSYGGDAASAPSSASLSEKIIGPPSGLATVSGSGQSAVYGSAFAKPLVVLVKDAQGGGAPGALVTFSVSGLKFTPTSVVTNESGEASVLVAAAATGSLSARATVSGVAAPATFTLAGTKAVLTVTAKNASVPYGQPIPALTYGITGYVNGDSAKVVTGKPTESTTAKRDSPVGTYPITLAKGSLAATNYAFTLVDGILTVKSLGTAKSPTFSPAAGTYTSAQSVILADATSGASIYFTTDGSTPTANSTKYAKPIAVAKTTTIKALGEAPGYTPSSVSSATYTIK